MEKDTEERGWIERDGCNTCAGRERKEERWSVPETDYDDHILNYVLHINKHHISFAVIFKALPLSTTE